MTNSWSDTLDYVPPDWKARLIGIPLVAFIMHFAFHKWHGINERLFIELIIDFSYTFSIWQGVRFIWLNLRNWFPLYTQTRKRLVLLILTVLIYTLVVKVVIFLLTTEVFPSVAATKVRFWDGYWISFVPIVVVTLLYECTFFFWAWRTNVQKTESLARENVQSQLEALKNQLDPHFLFNSLNTLASLIEDENLPAHTYLEQLADVYRYVLVSRDKNVVTLEEEMAFLDAYIYLNKTRYRENLQVEMDITPEAYHRHVAPLSLQLLVENAIKHNVVSKENPLKIKIWQEQDFLSIENNLQQKKTFEKSTKVGLQNIVNRYRLLTVNPVEVWQNEWSFKVKIPLLEA